MRKRVIKLKDKKIYVLPEEEKYLNGILQTVGVNKFEEMTLNEYLIARGVEKLSMGEITELEEK